MILNEPHHQLVHYRLSAPAGGGISIFDPTAPQKKKIVVSVENVTANVTANSTKPSLKIHVKSNFPISPVLPAQQILFVILLYYYSFMLNLLFTWIAAATISPGRE